MNGKFSNVKKVLAAFLGAFILIQCAAIGSFAADISPEAVVYVRPEVVSAVANQVGNNYVYVDVETANALNDHPVMAYAVDDSGELLALGYEPVGSNKATVKLGFADSVDTDTYRIVLAINRAAELAYCEVFYVGVNDVNGFFEAINMTDVEVSAVLEKLDSHYQALSVIEYSRNDEGEIILKLTGDDYVALSDEGKEEFAELILNGVNGKYSSGKGVYDAENSEGFVKDAYLVAAYNQGGFTDEELGEIIYRNDETLGIDVSEESIYGQIQHPETLVKVAHTMAEEVENVAALKEVLDKAVAVQLVNETHWANLVNVVEAHNDVFGVDEDEIEKLLKTKKLRNIFCEEFKATYYSIEQIQEAWEDAYDTAKDEYEDSKSSGGSGGGGGGGGGTPVITTNVVNTQLTDDKNNKDPEVIIDDYYTDMDNYSWASSAVLNLTQNGIIAGYGDKTFGPANSLTRAEFMKMIVNVFGFADITATTTFTDVDKDAWYYIYIASAEKIGLAEGYGNGLFGTNDAVTRQDAITLIYRAAKIKGLSLEKFSASADPLVDKNEIAPYAYEAVEKLYNTGVYLDTTIPTSINRFEPTRQASRVYIAFVLNQVYNYMK